MNFCKIFTKMIKIFRFHRDILSGWPNGLRGIAKKNQKSKDNTLLLFADSENSYDGKSTKDENKRNERRTVSAIDYSSDYSDWLMPTPPSEEIPINDEKETEEPAPASNGDKHNSPEQMRLF